jgi:citrate lyase subunit beta / citryl-CoA lyase
LNEALGRRRSAQRKLSQLRAQSVALIDDYRENLMGGYAASSSPEADAARGQIARLLEQAIADLPEAFRIVFMLREVEGLSVEETADALQIAAPTVKTRLLRARRRLQAAAPEKIRLWAMVETPMAILNARTIAATAVYTEHRLSCLVMGTNDLLKESRARALHNRFAVVPWLAMAVASARAYRLDILDGVYNDFKDEIGLREECEQGRTLGMDGKTLIHPSQVVPCNAIFSPTEEEVSWSRKIIAAFRQPGNAKKIMVEGRMVERLHLGMAERTVQIAEQIREMETACTKGDPSGATV